MLKKFSNSAVNSPVNLSLELLLVRAHPEMALRGGHGSVPALGPLREECHARALPVSLNSRQLPTILYYLALVDNPKSVEYP